MIQTDDDDALVPERDGSIRTMTHTEASALHTASTAVIAANTSRKYLLIVNDSANVVYLNVGTAVANKGIRLNANGGYYEMSPKHGNLYRGAVNALALTATSVLLVTEGV